MSTSHVEREIASQPAVWRLAGQPFTSRLAKPGQRVAIVGCGTSWFIAMSAAALREGAGEGLTDAFAASEFPRNRQYDLVVAISRSGTTTEVIDLLRTLDAPSVLITAVDNSPAEDVADATVVLPFADESSVVQTRFATSVLTLWRGQLGHDVEALVKAAESALVVPIDELLDAEQCTFVAQGWGVGLAFEAALKAREAAQFWSESYPAMDYRHGPISIAQPGRLVWAFGTPPEGLREQVEATGARFVIHDLDPQAALIVAQRFAVAVALRRGLDPDHPRSLTRSVILR